jgi:Mg2+ and Co2+ transporter CorA
VDNQVGKYLIIAGTIILVAGIVVYFFGGNFRWLGRLPGDIRIRRENFRFYFPLTTLILLNLLLFIIIRIWKWLTL